MRHFAFLLMVIPLAAACTDTEGSPLRDGGAGTADGAGAAGDGLPCDVADVLARNCLECHSEPLALGAPMPLTTYAATQAPAESDPSVAVWEMMGARINSTTAPMPPPEVGMLSESDKAILNAWIDASAPVRTGAGSCDDDGGVAGDGGGGVFEGVGPEHLPCEPSHRFLAHAAGSEAPFHVPADAGNLYECFAFRSPFEDGAQATAWAPVVDDARVLHHWILYRTATAQEDGHVGGCSMPTDAEFLMGWAPGGQNAVLPEDVGLELPGPDEWLILQIHYWNVAGHTDADDGSGVALCSTETPRANEAGVLWLGSIDIDIPARATDHTVTGSCPSAATNLLSEPMYILGNGPHMHELGTRFVTEIYRGGDRSRAETLASVDPWDFNSQAFYWHDAPIPLNPGDALETRCTYDNPGDSRVRFGERTEDEMCFDFMLVYPTRAFYRDQRKCIF